MNAFTSIGRLIWRTPPPPVDLLEAYAHEVIPVLDRAEWLYQYWLEQSTLFTDGEKLGNVAAIHRWEIASMGRSLERVVPPSVLAGSHEDVLDALETASRATQLLSNGSRFHNANAVCEGLALLGVSRERRLAARRSIYRYLERVAPSAIAETAASTAEAAASAALADVAAQKAATTEPPPAPEIAGEGAETVVETAETVAETAQTDATPSAEGAVLANESEPADGSVPATAPPGSSSAHTTDAAVSADVSGTDTALPPDLAALDLVVTDTPEPVPSWLDTARDEPESKPPVSEAPAPAEPSAPSQLPAAPSQPPAASSPPTTEPAPAAAPEAGTDPASNRPADDERDPPRSTGWGSLFGGRRP